MGSTINLDDIKRFEVTEVYSHPDAKVDIVLVHGLDGHPRRTWTAKNGVFWPTDLLPASLKSAHARILVYGYNADVHAFGTSNRHVSQDMIHQHAQSLLANLALERKSEETSDHPIIWVAHSLGGILVKRALELSSDLTSKNADDLRSIFVSTYGIIFLGTPHTGADAAKWGLILESMVSALFPKKILDTEGQLVRTLQTNNETLQNINLKFLDIYQRFQVCMVHEGIPTDLKGTKAIIVDQISAGPLLPDVHYFGIEATHSGMCRFENKNSPGYRNVSVYLKTWVEDSPPVIQGHWELEKRQRRQMKEAQAAELLGIYATPQLAHQPSTGTADTANTANTTNTPDPSSSVNNSTIIVKSTLSIEPDPDSEENAPYFIKPQYFRPNSLFVGRKEELAELHKMLFDKKRRAEGTSAVLIQSLPGGGKTHLARQYVYEHKDDFPGGIFWLRAKSVTELAAGFWDIARKAALKNVASTEEANSLEDPDQVIIYVREWLNRRHQWLMVLDGIHFGDFETLQKFLPDSKNTSLIYTSLERSISGDYHFINPQIIKLPSLSAVQAQRLLLLELDKKEPFHKDDLKYSMELVQAMGFLPVVIHAVARRLKATNEPLKSIARSYASQPKLRDLGTYIAVVEQLKGLNAHEALNLIYILCFFSQHIPVEMLALGLKGLDVPVRASEPFTGRSLNNTFKILNTFALIDRNEHEVSVQSSQSSKSSRDMLAENLDVIRLHSVVQAFFVDTLSGAGTLPMWLDRAVSVFCCSYDVANERIARKTNAGLVEDYRLYEIHGIKLREHVIRHQKKSPVLEEAHEMLDQRLSTIKAEIERRTPESSSVIAKGKSEPPHTSIFDRTSSSSDTGPETPGLYDKFHSRVSTWGLEADKNQEDSPLSLTHDTDYIKRMEFTYRNHFAMPAPEDAGYDSDREEAVSMTAQPSQRTIQRPLSPGGPWQEVRPRRLRPRPERLDLHRTIKNLERTRYRDSAGAYRAISAIDPRVSHETAQGFLQRTGSRAHSRGRISGQSGAEVALAHISKNSPPPARGGGMIQDRRSISQNAVERGRMMTGTPSYATAVVVPTRDTIPGFRDSVQEPQSSSESTSTLERPSSSAIASLQRFPIQVIRQSPSPSPRTPYTPRPPYPPSPNLHPASDTVVYQIPGRYSQENLSLGPDPYLQTIYPALEGFPPTESNRATISSSPGKRDYISDYPAFQSHTSLPALMRSQPSNASSNINPTFLSLSSPNIKTSNSTYYPGRPELSNQEGGYSSQPMSRDPSGQSERSANSTGQLERAGGRKASLAETEPIPRLPVFSPRIAPTSYQVYERMRERDLLSSNAERGRSMSREGSRERGGAVGMRKSPRLGYARTTLIERLDEWGGAIPSGPNENNQPQPQPQLSRRGRQFDPTAPAFSPSPSSFTYSPNMPPVPANSMLSSTANSNPSTNYHSTTTSAYPSQYPSPHPPQNTPLPLSQRSSPPYQSPRSFNSGLSYPSPLPPQNTPSSFNDGVEMERSGSGGVRVGRRVIEFGDFPEGVEVEAARERVVRSWGERERDAARRRNERNEAVVGLGLDLQERR